VEVQRIELTKLLQSEAEILPAELGQSGFSLPESQPGRLLKVAACQGFVPGLQVCDSSIKERIRKPWFSLEGYRKVADGALEVLQV
jgi:hypothetical protein